MEKELLKFKDEIKGIYFYLLISGMLIFSIFILIFVLHFIFNYKLDLFDGVVGIIISVMVLPFYIFSSFLIFLISFLGYRNFCNKIDYDSFYDLRYKFTISLVLLGFIQYSFLSEYVVLLFFLFIPNVFILYKLFFSENVRTIGYLQELEEMKKKEKKDYL